MKSGESGTDVLDLVEFNGDKIVSDHYISGGVGD